MSYYRYSFLLALGLGMSGCAITSGLQTYDLPAEGFFRTDAGTRVNLIKITQDNLFALQPAQLASQDLKYPEPHLLKNATAYAGRNTY